MATIVIFTSSFFVASAFISIKAVELKYKKRNVILMLLSRLDMKSKELVSNLRFRILQLVQSVRYIALVQTKIICKNLLSKVEEKIMEEYRTRHNIIMGRREIINNGSASFYLKKITENKTGNQRGKIEDSL